MKIQNIEEGQNLIALKLGKARTIKGHYSIVNLDDYTEKVRKLSQIIEFCANHSALTNSIEVSRLKLKVVEGKLRTLNQHH